MKENFQERTDKAKALINNAECILIGGGAGLSAAAGLTYSGERFTANFADFIRKYGMKDMYSAGFYPFATQEEKWAYRSRHILLNRFLPPALPLYKGLFALVKDKDHFVLTTNVDGQFYKAGFCAERIFAVQGGYGKIQCAKAATTNCMTTKRSCGRWTPNRKTAASPLTSCPNAPSAAAIWR